MSTSVSNVALTSAALEEHVVQRAAAVVGLGGIALVHLLDVEDRLTEVPYIGYLFLALIAVSLGLAAALIRTDDRRVWLAAGLMAGATIVGYAITRTVGMPNDGGEDIGNWTEPLGLASLMIEGIVVALAFARLADKD
jgi:predicted tellurium resistance membrane protein TerC